MSIEKKPYYDAAKLDILDLLDKDAVGVFEFRQIATIARAMETLLDAVGTPTEQGVIRITMDMAEYKAPNLHQALVHRAFDGETLLQKKYAKMLDEHTELRRAAIQIQQAQSEIGLQRAALEEHHSQLRLERERLQLEASNAGRSVKLPPLPQLTKPRDDSEPEAGEAWDPEQADPDKVYEDVEKEETPLGSPDRYGKHGNY